VVAIIDASISLLGGVLAILIGFRYIGPKPGTNEKYDALHGKWLKHLRWLGALGMVFPLVQISIAVSKLQQQPAETSAYKADLRGKVETAIAENGVLATQDYVFDSADGFSILIPAGYIYSKPANTPFAVVAVGQVDSTPVISVMVVSSSQSQQDLLKDFKALQAKQSASTSFSEPTTVRNGNTDVTRVTVLSLRENNVLTKSNMLFASGRGKHYVAVIGTRDELYSRQSAELERVVASFNLR